MPEEVIISMDEAIKQSMNAEPPAVSNADPVPDPIANPVIQPEEPVKQDDPVKQVDPLKQDEPVKQDDPVVAAEAFDETKWLQQHFGENTVETIKAKLAAEPPPIKFANETSKKIHELLVAGKEAEVTEYLSQKAFVASLKEKKPEEIIKEGWKKEFGLTDTQADRRFVKTYTVDEYADDKDIEEKIVATNIKKDAEIYKKYFAEYEQNISLPTIEPQVTAPLVDYTSEEAKKAIAFSEQLNKPIADLTNIPFELNDSNLKLKGQVAFPTAEVAKIESQLEGQEDKFIEARWFPKGNFNKQLFARDIYFLTHPEEVLRSVASQVAAQARVEFLKENRNHQPGDKVIAGDFAPSEDEKKRAFYREYWM